VPYRSVAGVVEAITFGENEGRPPRYTWRGDHIEFAEEPSAGETLTFHYYLRPSKLVEAQTAGLITAVDTTTRTVTVASMPVVRATGATLASGARMDVVKPNGWHELPVVNAVGTLTFGFFVSFPAGTDLSDVEVGDYLRTADETDWPCLPDDHHRTLADLAAISVLTSKNLEQKANALMKKCGPALERLQDLLNPRVKNDPPAIVPTVGLRRRGHAYRDLPR
jgi:hypothetical protein